MNNYYEIQIQPQTQQPPPPSYTDNTPLYSDNTPLYTNALHTIIIDNAYSGPPNPNWRQEIEENQTASFADRKCLFFIFFSGFVIYLIYYICRDAL
jgi:hypothetical protein